MLVLIPSSGMIHKKPVLINKGSNEVININRIHGSQEEIKEGNEESLESDEEDLVMEGNITMQILPP